MECFLSYSQSFSAHCCGEGFFCATNGCVRSFPYAINMCSARSTSKDRVAIKKGESGRDAGDPALGLPSAHGGRSRLLVLGLPGDRPLRLSETRLSKEKEL